MADGVSHETVPKFSPSSVAASIFSEQSFMTGGSRSMIINE